MSSDEPQIKYQEVSPFQISEGFTPTRSQKMEPVKTSRIFLAAVAGKLRIYIRFIFSCVKKVFFF